MNPAERASKPQRPMATEHNRYGIRARRFLIHRGIAFQPLGDEVPEGAWLWRTILGGTVELYRAEPVPRKVKPAEVVVYALAAVLVCGAGLLALPILVTAVGVLLPVAVISWMVLWALKQMRS